MLTKLRNIFLPNTPNEPATIPGLIGDDLATVRALDAYNRGATATEAMAVFRGETA